MMVEDTTSFAWLEQVQSRSTSTTALALIPSYAIIGPPKVWVGGIATALV